MVIVENTYRVQFHIDVGVCGPSRLRVDPRGWKNLQLINGVIPVSCTLGSRLLVMLPMDSFVVENALGVTYATGCWRERRGVRESYTFNGRGESHA